ncbi:hypothetical protein GCM10027399_00510 [Curvibacter fontanus]
MFGMKRGRLTGFSRQLSQLALQLAIAGRQGTLFLIGSKLKKHGTKWKHLLSLLTLDTRPARGRIGDQRRLRTPELALEGLRA